jgi:hypothetical protein
MPLRINGRLYFRRAELEAYKQRLIQQALFEGPTRHLQGGEAA